MKAQRNRKFFVITYNWRILLKNQVAHLTNEDRGQSSTWYRAIFLYEIAIATFAQYESISTHWFRDGSLHFRYCHRSPLIALWRVFIIFNANGQINATKRNLETKNRDSSKVVKNAAADRDLALLDFHAWDSSR